MEEFSQIKFDEKFIKKLLEKLKVGNTRSIHLNSIPGRSATRIDLSQLGIINEILPANFIALLLNNESFSFEVSFDDIDIGKLDEGEKKQLALLSKKLNTTVIENNDNYLEFGIKNFGIGFPLLIKRDRTDPTKIIKAPLFIWNLDIERSYQNKNTWTIKREEDSSIKLNELLISHISKDESIHLDKIPKEILEDGILDQNELLGLCKNILLQLNIKTEELELKIEKCPDSKEIELITNSKPWIQWSGIFGIYLSQKETIIQSTEELLGRIDEFESENLVLSKFQTSTISAIDTDPSKDEIINTLTKNEIKLIQGPPGTGKSQSITAIISNALANGARCLVVCEKKTALDVIQENLNKAGLGNFSILIDDVNKDRKKVIEKARTISDNEEYPHFSKLDFDSKYENFCKIKEDLGQKYAEPLKKVFGDYSWKDLIGLYLRFSKSPNFKNITKKLDYSKLAFNHEEYSDYLNIVEEASYIYEDLEERSEKIFSDLSSDLFSEQYKWATHEKVKNNTEDLLKLIESIKEYLGKRIESDYEVNDVSIFHTSSIDDCLNLTGLNITYIEELLSKYKQGLDLVGLKFNEKTYFQYFSLLVNSIFRTNHKNASKLRKTIPDLVLNINEVTSNLRKLGFIDLDIKTFKEYESYSAINMLMEDTLCKIRQINSDILSIANTRDALIRYESNLYELLLSKIYTFKKINYLDLKEIGKVKNFYGDFYNKLILIKEHLSAYESYHTWKFFELKRNKDELEILHNLKITDTKDWKNIFKAWYYRGALLKHEANSQIGFNKSDKKLEQLSVLHGELKLQQLNQIKYIWDIKRMDKIASFKNNFNTLYNLRKNKTFERRNSLRKIVETDLSLFTTLFPVILTNPSAVNSIFPLKQGLFEIVIFDEASQLRISDTFTSLIRGEYKIIAGDKHQMPPSSYFQGSSESLDSEQDDDESIEDYEQSSLAESESLLEYAENLTNINKSNLDYHYRSEHPALIEFSNHAFYGGNLIAFPAQEVYTPIEFRSVNGRYELRMNPAEIAEIIKIIRDEIHPNQKGNYPSIGIATFNINQRNLIIESLNNVAEQDPLFARKLQILREKGLFVKNLENIQGDERDIIIISTTYGIKPDGKFSQNFARLNRIEGYKLLNVLITRAKKKLFVCTSIPKEKYLSYNEVIENEGNNKKGILYAYLAYAEAISNHDNTSAEIILMSLKKQSYEKPRIISQGDGLSESPFEEEVYEELLEHFDKKDIIQQHKVGGFRLDFVVKTKYKDIVLECDGKTYHQSDEAHAHDIYRQKELEYMGFTVYRIWSTSWFQDKEIEMQKFLEFTNK